MTYPIEKVTASPSGIAAVATGHSALCAKVRRLIAGLGLGSLSGAMRTLPHELRKACTEQRAHCRAIGARYEVELTCGLIGLCDGEMRGVVFEEAADFEPREASAWLSPDVGGAPRRRRRKSSRSRSVNCSSSGATTPARRERG
jgi:hypothetical protein